ncbi:hypothetical protein LAV79_20730 [Peribacillus butanolivorans]|uniref:hypothetical protein n=1 Tax=Peribacillus butanolivorans TaxID=421767 RepID=UPI0030C9B7DE
MQYTLRFISIVYVILLSVGLYAHVEVIPYLLTTVKRDAWISILLAIIFLIRLKGFTYGTEKKLEEIFTSKVPFNYPFTSSRINQPDYMQQQESTVPAITLQELIYQYNEKTKTILLPNILLEEDIMKKDTDNVPVTTFNGAFIIKDKKLKDHLSKNDLKGYIRVNNKAVRSLVNMEERKIKRITKILL